MGHKSDTVDARLSEIAACQHGVVSLRQLEELGLSRYAVAKRSEKGRLHRIHRGVYAVGHRGLSLHGRFMAAVLACGEGAVLSHTSAVVLWGLLKPLDGPVHISIPSTSGRARRPGIHLHRSPSLAEPSPSPSYPPQAGGRRGRLSPRATTHRHRIPVTNVPRTLEDLRATNLLAPHLLRRAIRQAELKGHRLGGIVTDRTRSDLESLFLALVGRYGLPRPEVNVRLGRHEVDFLWRAQRLVVETDFWAYHRGSVAFYADSGRDLDLRSAGYAVLRFTDRQLEAEPERVAADVAAALSVSGIAPG
ncbi:MAG TPA: type IV toxin-antitoxin system AbiEi family antitoxin domain-containing protein [Solirubrobacterales bacterium]